MSPWRSSSQWWVQSGKWLFDAHVVRSVIRHICKSPLAWQLEGKNLVGGVLLEGVSLPMLILRDSFEIHLTYICKDLQKPNNFGRLQRSQTLFGFWTKT